MNPNTLRAMLHRGCGLPAARDLASLMLTIAERNEQDRSGFCASGCTPLPTRVVNDEALCEKCYHRMMAH